jgi:hypothetical protein
MTSFKVHQDKSAFTGKSILYLNRHQTEEWKGWMQVLIVLLSSAVFPRSQKQLFFVIAHKHSWVSSYGSCMSIGTSEL